MILNRINDIFFQHRRVFGDAKTAIAGVAARPACNLAQFSRGQSPGSAAIKFDIPRQRDMVNIHIQPHANSIGGHHVINITRLEQFDLGVTGAGAERAHDNRRAATLGADQFGQFINICCAEGDNGGPPWQAGDFLLPSP